MLAIQNTAVMRFVLILYWLRLSHLIGDPNRSDELTAMDPTSAVAGVRFLTHTPAQSAPYDIVPRGDSTLDFPWFPDLDFLHPVVPTQQADRWSNAPTLVFPSVDPLNTPAWNEEREVKVPQSEASYG